MNNKTLLQDISSNEKKIIYWERLHTIVLIILTIVETYKIFIK